MLSQLSFFLFLFCSIASIRSHSHDDLDEDLLDDYKFVTCGSVVKLLHSVTHRRLHSHKVSYGNSGSGQQSVTAVSDKDDTNSLWSIGWSPENPCASGDPIKKGQIIRLRHVNTGKNLHSHLHTSPLSHNQEVSAFGENGDDGDTGDNWRVHVDGDFWRRGELVRLQHVDTGKYMETSSRHKFGNPIPGHQEVYCTHNESKNSRWLTEDGLFFAIRDPTKEN